MKLRDEIDKILADTGYFDTYECELSVFETYIPDKPEAIALTNELNPDFPELPFFRDLMRRNNLKTSVETITHEKTFTALAVYR